jgi:phosphomannomutase/phosphoglucomutase
MKHTVFKNYDIRGRVPEELPLEEIYDLGKAIAVYVISINPATKNVVVGMDGRAHSPLIKDELCRALQDSGLDVFFLGICPTPLMYFAQHTLSIDVGIMITASHNGPEYNGFKLSLQGEPIWGTAIERIEELFYERASLQSAYQGTYEELPIHDRYLEWMLHHFVHLVGMSLPIVFDCGHGATATIIPELIERFEWKNAQLLCGTVDSTFPVHHPDPVKLENVQHIARFLQENDAQCAIAFDGDGDRMAAMTKKGKLVPGDILLALFSESLISQYPTAAVMYDIKCSSLLPALLTSWGAEPIMVPSGHSIIKSEMKKQGAILAGELSCHFFFKDRYFGYDDGIYAACRLIEQLLLSRKTLDELTARWDNHYASDELRVSCSEEKKQYIVENMKQELLRDIDLELIILDGIRFSTSYGTAIIRASHTEPVLCVRWESDTQSGYEQIERYVYGLFERHYPFVIKEFIAAKGKEHDSYSN